MPRAKRQYFKAAKVTPGGRGPHSHFNAKLANQLIKLVLDIDYWVKDYGGVDYRRNTSKDISEAVWLEPNDSKELESVHVRYDHLEPKKRTAFDDEIHDFIHNHSGVNWYHSPEMSPSPRRSWWRSPGTPTSFLPLWTSQAASAWEKTM